MGCLRSADMGTEPADSGRKPKVVDDVATDKGSSPTKVAALPMEFDKILEAAGDSGIYQITLFVLISVMMFAAVDSFAINFLAGKMEHRCRNADSFPNDVIVNTSAAWNSTGHGSSSLPNQTQWPNLPSEQSGRCWRYADYDNDFETTTSLWELGWKMASVNNSDGNVDAHSERSKVKCDRGWTYDQSEFVSTIVSEWDLVCDRAWLVDFVSFIYMIGRLFACVIYGSIADRFGRKPTVLLFHSVKLVGSVMSIYAPNYIVFVLSRFIIAVGSTASNLCTFIIVSEVSGNKYRTAFGIGWSLMLSVGSVVMPGIAYGVRDFRKLQSIYTYPQIALLIYVLVLDESPRWLTTKRRIKAAMTVLHKIAAVNGRSLPDGAIVERIRTASETPSGKIRPHKACECGIIKLVASPNLRMRSLILWLNWFTDSLIYYALSLNAGRLPGSVFLNMFLLSVVEIPANLAAVFLLDRVGRRMTLGVSTLLAGISSLLMIPFMFIDSAEVAVQVFAILGKTFITTAYSSAYIVTSETYPTSIRGVGMGVSTSFARFSSLFASFVGGIMTEAWKPLPSVLFGVLGLLSGGLVFLLPETMNRRLPNTLSEAEGLSRRGDVDIVEVSADDEKCDPMTGDDVIIEIGLHQNDLTVSTILSIDRATDVLNDEKIDPLFATGADDDDVEQ